MLRTTLPDPPIPVAGGPLGPGGPNPAAVLENGNPAALGDVSCPDEGSLSFLVSAEETVSTDAGPDVDSTAINGRSKGRLPAKD